jgi:pimeloyl-ACP methyl ester carboxylesterase
MDLRRALGSAALILMLTLTGAPAPGVASARSPAIASKAVIFSVQNVNRSKLSCATDGAAYQIRGHLVGRRSALASSARRRPAATLYLHGLALGEWFWNFNAVPRYNYATAQAKAGHVSVVIDRLGYDSSGHPDGNKSCVGGQADIAHQIVQSLRTGRYTLEGGKPLRFKRVALAGHSLGAVIAITEAYSFRDIDALLDMSFSFSSSPRAALTLGPPRDACLTGGQPPEPGTPSGYAYLGQPGATDFESIMFHSATRSVRDAADALRNRDPCGDFESTIPALLQETGMVKRIKVPVLVICGRSDALFSSLGCGLQRERFTGSRSASLELVKGAGHALTLEAQTPTFRRKVSRWLAKHGF